MVDQKIEGLMWRVICVSSLNLDYNIRNGFCFMFEV